MSAAFVYAVVPAAYRPPELAGLGDPPAPVRTVAVEDVAAVVSDLPAEATPGTRSDLEAHARVLAAVVESGVTVIPVRFGLVFDGDAAVREHLLEPRRGDLRQLLERLGGRVQMTIKAVYDEQAVLREIVGDDPEINRLSEATRSRPDAEVHADKVRLGELVAAALERRRAQDERMLLDALGGHAEEILVEPARHEQVALHAQLLVRQEQRGDLDACVQRLAEQQAPRIHFRFVGPLAPWSFADVELEPETAGWA
jgi:hypothetical protein